MLIISPFTDPYKNLALEEYILKNLVLNETILFLWQNDSSVIIGRNQNIYEEVNLLYTKEHAIPVIRRKSGGGTVYHDLGNINYSVIADKTGYVKAYEKLTKPVVDFLISLGLEAHFFGKSDIYIGNTKISGNAQYLFGNRILHHGTLLFNSNLETLNLVLKNKQAISSTSVKSNRALVGNISDYINLSLTDFKNKMINYFNMPIYTLTELDIAKATLLMNTYQSYEWNYGESPTFNIHKESNHYSVNLTIEKGIIVAGLIAYNNRPLDQPYLNKPFHPDTFSDYLELKNILFE